MARLKILMKLLILASITIVTALPTAIAAMEVQVTINKAYVIELEKPASTVSVANPEIADVTVQSPKVILIIGKAVGETTVNISHEVGLLSYDVFVSPSTDNKVTVNLGSDAVKTLQCQPRCVRIGNPDLGSKPNNNSSTGAGPASTGLAK